MSDPSDRRSRDWAAANEQFVELRRSGDRVLRARLVEANEGLAHHFANTYRGRGLEMDDLEQVARMGLVKAVDRFDPDTGAPFASFARRYIVGEIRHHFRDLGWDLKVPRGLKELHAQVAQARRELTEQLGASPSVEEIAAHVDVATDDVLEALDAGSAYTAGSLEKRLEVLGDAGEPSTTDAGFLTVERRAVLEEVLSDLDDREREILYLRFDKEMSQEAIAEQVGVSQVHVGRLLRSTLADLRMRVAPQLRTTGSEV